MVIPIPVANPILHPGNSQTGHQINVIFEEMDQFRESVGHGVALLGLDVGSKTIGIAVSDTRQVVATPLATIARTRARKDAEQVLGTAGHRQIGGLLLGLPRHMNGTEGSRCQSTRAFGRTLASVTGLPIGYWDERLSTVEAERRMLEAGLSRRSRGEKINHVAAAIILQGALDRMAMAGASA